MSVYMHSNNGLKKQITACICALHFTKQELRDNLQVTCVLRLWILDETAD